MMYKQESKKGEKMIYLDYIFKNLFNIIFIIMFGFFILYGVTFIFSDDTDNPVTKTRSGLSLYTDHGTGCQYLKAGMFGNLIPRLDENGNQICVKSQSSK